MERISSHLLCTSVPSKGELETEQIPHTERLLPEYTEVTHGLQRGWDLR